MAINLRESHRLIDILSQSDSRQEAGELPKEDVMAITTIAITILYRIQQAQEKSEDLPRAVHEAFSISLEERQVIFPFFLHLIRHHLFQLQQLLDGNRQHPNSPDSNFLSGLHLETSVLLALERADDLLLQNQKTQEAATLAGSLLPEELSQA